MEHVKEHRDLLMGSRKEKSNQPNTFELFIEKAKKLGFSIWEIERLRECYFPKARILL